MWGAEVRVGLRGHKKWRRCSLDTIENRGGVIRDHPSKCQVTTKVRVYKDHFLAIITMHL